MRYMWLAIVLLSSIVYGSEGKEVYDKKCASCHELYIPLAKLEENFMKQSNMLLSLKAPTINQIVYRLKTRIGDPNSDEEIHRMEIESFLTDYFDNPDKAKSVCLPQILEYFDTMPSMKGLLNEDEFAAINEFLYTYDPKTYRTEVSQHQGYEEALKQAKEQHKLVMLFFTAEHCRYCKRMEHDVMSDAEVITEIGKGFVSLKIDIDHEKIPIDFRPQMTPTFLFLSPQQEIVYHVPGSWGKEDFLLILKEAQKKFEQSQKKGVKQ